MRYVLLLLLLVVAGYAADDRRPMVKSTTGTPTEFPNGDTLRVAPRQGLDSSKGVASAYTKCLYLATDTQKIYYSDGTSWVTLGAIVVSPIGATPNAQGMTLTSGALNLEPASASFGGAVTTGTQTFAGAKTFTGAISASNLSGTNTGDQTITLTGDVTGSGTGSFAATVEADAVTNAKLANVATQTFKGRTTAATGDPEDLTAAQATAMLGVVTTSLKGLAPASGGGTVNFLRADGTWTAPSSGGITGTLVSGRVPFANGTSSVTDSANLTYATSTGLNSTQEVIVGGVQVSGGINWSTRVAPNLNSLSAVAYGNNIFVAVSLSGTGNRVTTSPDGVKWTARVSAEDNSWRAICYGNGLFVAVADSGTNRVMTSPDGITWTARSAAAATQWACVCYGNGLFVATSLSGTGNRVMTSPDGVTWTIRTSAADNQWFAVCYGNGLFVAASLSGTGNRVMTSPDGVTWTSRTSAADNSWRAICYGNGLYVAVSLDGSGNRVMTSPDGVTWTIGASATNNPWGSVCYGNGLFVACGASAIMTSSDGIAWVSRTGAINAQAGVVHANGIFVVVCDSASLNNFAVSGKLTSLSSDFGGDLVSPSLGRGLKIKEGTNAKMGTAVLVAGTLTVSTTAVTATSRIFLTSQADSGTVGFQRVSARTAASSFTITSSNPLDTSTIAWFIVEPSP